MPAQRQSVATERCLSVRDGSALKIGPISKHSQGHSQLLFV